GCRGWCRSPRRRASAATSSSARSTSSASTRGPGCGSTVAGADERGAPMTTAPARLRFLETGLKGAAARLADSERWLGALLIAPAIIYIAALVGFPFLLAIFYSLSNATVGTTSVSFVGLDNYRAVMESPTFWVALKNTLIFAVVSQVAVVVLAKILANLLHMYIRGHLLMHLMILLSWLASITIGSCVCRSIL